MFVYIFMSLTGPPTVKDKVSLRCLSCGIRDGTIMQCTMETDQMA